MRLDRLSRIENYIMQQEHVSLENLAEKFQLSVNTARRDVIELEKRGCLKETTRVLATHFSHNAGLLHQGLSQAGAQYGIEVAYDGLIWEKT